MSLIIPPRLAASCRGDVERAAWLARLPDVVRELRRRWALTTETLADEASWPDPALVRAGLDLFRELPATADRQVLLCTDLHAGNVLRAQREPWLAIDPKPFVGDPTYDATQHLRNCVDRMRADPRTTITRVAEQLGLSPERLRLWTFARAAAEPRARWYDDVWIDIARRIAP